MCQLHGGRAWFWRATLNVAPREFQAAGAYLGFGARQVNKLCAHQATLGWVSQPPHSLSLGSLQNRIRDRALGADCNFGQGFQNLGENAESELPNVRKSMECAWFSQFLESEWSFGCAVCGLHRILSEATPRGAESATFIYRLSRPSGWGTPWEQYLPALLVFSAFLRWHQEKPWGGKARDAKIPAWGGTWSECMDLSTRAAEEMGHGAPLASPGSCKLCSHHAHMKSLLSLTLQGGGRKWSLKNKSI